MHETGEMVQWAHDGEPSYVGGTDLKRAVTQLAVACLLKRHYPGGGSRHEGALVIGGVFARAEWNPDDIKHVIEVVARAAGDDEWRDRATTAASAVNVKANGKDVPGLTRLAEVWGKDAADTLGRWLNMRTDGPARIGPPPPFTAEELSTMRFEPIKYVVPGYFVEGLTLLAAKPKVGKSWMMLHAAIAVARGGFTLGEIHCPEGDVLYCALEDNRRRLQSRMTKLIGISQPWPKRLSFQTEMPRLAGGGIVFIRNWIENAKHPRLVIIDTLAMVKTPKSNVQTQYEADYDSIMELRKIANQHNVAIVLVHHLRKAESDDAFDTISGTLGLTGAPDTIIVLKRDTTGTTTLYAKGRDLVEVEKAIQFNKNSCVWTIIGDASEVHRSNERATILKALTEAGDNPLGPNQIASACGMKSGNVRRLLGKMKTEGLVTSPSYGKYTLCPPRSAADLQPDLSPGEHR
jgi:hypothetical protein